MLTAFLTMWNKPSERIKSQRFIIEEGAKVEIDGEDCQMLTVIADGQIFHPVVSVEVL